MTPVSVKYTMQLTILSDCVVTGTVLHRMFEQEAQTQSRIRVEPSEFATVYQCDFINQRVGVVTNHP